MHGSCHGLERANAKPGRYVEVPTVGVGSSGHNGYLTTGPQAGKQAGVVEDLRALLTAAAEPASSSSGQSVGE